MTHNKVKIFQNLQIVDIPREMYLAWSTEFYVHRNSQYQCIATYI